jgi:5'-3' exonuclease
MIIIDLSQVMISNFMAQIGNHTDVKLDEGLFRHMVLNSIRVANIKFKGYGEIVIACDDKKTWRKEIFPLYKANRKRDREKSEINWPEVFNILNKVKLEIKDNFKYRVIQVSRAEADDVIGTLAHKFGNMLNTGEKIMILSGDKDFAQLHVYGNVRQYDPVRKRFIAHTDPVQFTRELILKGDRGDGIPNILSNDDVFVSGGRQKPITEAKIIKWLNQEPKDFCNEEMLRNYSRNVNLIDLACIPESVRNNIIDVYENAKGKTKQEFMNYMIAKRLKNLLEVAHEF